ncbi:DNA polymerase III subunit delta' [Actinokineospora globicatena]|uniref:DNA polymerase III subunit delta' n=1 Tax=Actinokineospora globicatena TaxID=103729 RepID=UPI0020A4B6DF|nr:DNA polymerase III subunit delta' [Actinokineospora globicatena]MCP2300949.1 DNA polymerase-3 subunit delta' [Actinokineospora globicatena]GLW77420.1 DNA polymerase III subunit delta' [Actinokineospora globicatena]GLW84254.1 DNA polymerase III subunit delta' [Actinokineospora globicatena]
MAVWSQLVGQTEAISVLSAAATAAAELVDGTGSAAGMTHAWLFTGPPGSGRSVAARAFAAALECTTPGGIGCGECQGCHTAMSGTHADVRMVVPEGLSISVAEMRALVQTSARRPTGGRWQVVVITDADRLTEGAANALLKAVEEPPPRTVFLLCAPSDHPDDVSVTIRSRCRVVALRTPSAAAIAEVLQLRDRIDAETASWAASVCSGHVGRARRLATDPAARERRDKVLRIPINLRRLSDVFDAADDLVKTAEADAGEVSGSRDEVEKEALKTALGAGGTGKGTASATRGSAGAIKELERRQKSRATRTQRDALDLALVDLAGFYRDVLVTSSGSTAALNHPDHSDGSRQAAAKWTQESTLRRLEAVLACREAIELNVKPRIAVESMITQLYMG